MSKLITWFWKQVEKSDKARMALQTMPSDLDELTDIAYNDDGHRHHLLDIYRPKNTTGKLPFIIDIHGGGWYYGDKELNKNYALHLAQFGFAVVGVSYRLVPEVTIYDQIKDIFDLFDFLVKHSDEYGLDLANAFITGDSAGGFLTALALNILTSKELQSLFGMSSDIKFKAAGFTCPAFNIGNISKKRYASIYVKPMYDKDFRESKYLKAYNTLDYINADYPPSFFSSAYADFLHSQAKLGFEKAKSLGLQAELCYFHQQHTKGHSLGHVFNVLQPEWKESKQVNDRLITFFKKYID